MKIQFETRKAASMIARSMSVAILLLASLSVDAQNTTATLLGTVTDQTGSTIAAASVTARNTDIGLTRTVVTGEDGSYRFEFLPTGTYSIEVTATSGFKKAIKNGVILQLNETIRIDVLLEVGSVRGEVTITSEPPDVNTTTTELGRTVQSAEISNLPLV